MSIEITDWLCGLGLEQYAPAFRDNDIDGDLLRRLTAEDLRELGVASVGHRRGHSNFFDPYARADRQLNNFNRLRAGAQPNRVFRRALQMLGADAVMGADEPSKAEPAVITVRPSSVPPSGRGFNVAFLSAMPAPAGCAFEQRSEEV